MDLGEFVVDKLTELADKYRDVELDSLESVMLLQNGTASQFSSEQTPLEQKGREVKLSDLEQTSTIPFVANGTVVKFKVKAPRKRKHTSLEYHFLWD